MLRAWRLHTYLLVELFLPTLLGLVLYTFTLLMNEFFLVARDAIAKDLGWDLIFRMFLYQVPKVLVLTIPMATLLGTLVAVGRLSSDHEWVALQAAGLGPTFLVRPVLLHGLLATLVAFVIYGEAVPLASYASRDLLAKVLTTSSIASELRPRVFYDDLPGVVLFVDEIRPGNQGHLEGVFVYQSAPPGTKNTEQVILARKGDLYQATDGSSDLAVDLQDGVQYSYRASTPDNYVASHFERYRFPLKPPDFLRLSSGPRNKTVQDMDLRELRAELKAADLESNPTIRPFRQRGVRTEIQQRIALPMACLLFALVAMPLGINHARSGKGAGFAISLAVIFVYWVLFILTRNQATRGKLPVTLGVWGANLVMLAWILYSHVRMALTGNRESKGVLRDLAGRLLSLLSFLFARNRRRPADAEKSERSDPTLFRPLSILGLSILAVYAASELVVRFAPDSFLARLLGPGVSPLLILVTAAVGLFMLFGIADRYLVSHFLRILALAVLSAYLVYGLVELKGLLDGMFQSHQPVSLVGRYFKYFLPGMLQFTLPVSCLVAAVVTFTLLFRRGELTALKASGMSMRRATTPVIAVTLLLCGALFVIQDRVTPTTNRKAQEVKDQLLGRAPRSYGYALPGGGRFTFGTKDRLYRYRLYDQDKQTFQGLSVFQLDPTGTKILEHVYAASARFDGSAWELAHGWKWSMPAGVPERGGFSPFESAPGVPLDPPEAFSRRETTLTAGTDLPDQMSLDDLGKQIESLTGSGYDTTRLRVAYYAKLSLPLTPLVMLLLGLPFAFKVGRSGSLYAVGVSLVLVIVYWATLAVFNALGLETILPPLLAASAPNVVYGLLGAYLLLYIKT